MTILITGATGAVGTHLITALLERGAQVRALTRNPQDADLPEGVDVVGGDLSEPTSLGREVFDGVDRAFVFPVDDIEPFVAAAVDAGVHRFTVLSSLAAALEHPRDHGSASQVHHSAVETAVTERTDEWTILRPGTFANNLLSWAWPIRSGAPIRAPYLASAQAPIHEKDVADVAAESLLTDDHLGAAIAMTGPEAITRSEQVAIIGRALDRDIPVVEITPEEFRAETAQFIPEAVVGMLLDYWRDTLSVPDRPRTVTPVTGRPGRTLAEWAADHRADFVG